MAADCHLSALTEEKTLLFQTVESRRKSVPYFELLLTDLKHISPGSRRETDITRSGDAMGRLKHATS